MEGLRATLQAIPEALSLLTAMSNAEKDSSSSIQYSRKGTWHPESCRAGVSEGGDHKLQVTCSPCMRGPSACLGCLHAPMSSEVFEPDT